MMCNVNHVCKTVSSILAAIKRRFKLYIGIEICILYINGYSVPYIERNYQR